MPSQYGQGQAPHFPPQPPVQYNSENPVQMPVDSNNDPTRAVPGVNPAYNPPLAGMPPSGAAPGSVSSPTTPGMTKKKPVPDWVVSTVDLYVLFKIFIVLIFFL
jgi:hypothetical protein